MTKPVVNALGWLDKARELQFCFFALSFVLLADAYCGAAGILAFGSEGIERVALQHWISFGLSALFFYSFASRVLQWVTLSVLSAVGAERWIARFSEEPDRRTDAAERSRNYVHIDQLRSFAVLHDNKSALAVVEHHQKAWDEEERAERTQQHNAFCFLIALWLGSVAPGPLMQAAWSWLPSHRIAFVPAALLLLAALYIGIIRSLTWSRKIMVRLPDHDLEIPGAPPREQAAPPSPAGKGGPRPSATEIKGSVLADRH